MMYLRLLETRRWGWGWDECGVAAKDQHNNTAILYGGMCMFWVSKMTLAIGFHALYRPEVVLQVPGGWGAGICYWRGAWMVAWMAWNDHLSTSVSIMPGALL